MLLLLRLVVLELLNNQELFL